MRRTRSLPIALLAAALTMSAIGSAHATPITYEYRGVGGGSLGMTNFFNAPFVITALADTNNIAPWVYADLQNTHLSTTIFIEGLGDFLITDPSHTWVAGSLVGIGANLSLNWLTLSNSAVVGYGLASNLGPVASPGQDVWQFHNVTTSGGLLAFSSIPIASFQATTGPAPVPEPASLLLFGTGLVGLGVWKKRRG